MEPFNKYIEILNKEGNYKLFIDQNRIKITQYRGSYFFAIFFIIIFCFIPLAYIQLDFILTMFFLFVVLMFFSFIYSLINSFVYKVCLNNDNFILKKISHFKIRVHSLPYYEISHFFISYEKDNKSANILLKKETGEEIQILLFQTIKKENVAQLKVALKCLNDSLKNNHLSLSFEKIIELNRNVLAD